MNRIGHLILLTAILLGATGCASLGHKIKSLISGKPSEDKEKEKEKARFTKYSDAPNSPLGMRRKYQRMNKEALQNSSDLDERAGSLWVMEGQGAYLFAQNIVRLIGDPVNVLIEGEPKEQLEAKAKVIKKLLARIEKRNNALRGPADDQTQNPAGANPAPAAPPGQDKAAAPSPEAPENENDETSPFNVKTVPTRITEKLSDGNYRVKGAQNFMIGKREYKVIVTGVVRSEDFDENGVPAGKLLDPSFDIVSQRRGQNL